MKKSAEKIIKSKVNSRFVQSLIVSKGWTTQQATDHVREFVTSGTRLSLYDFLMSK